MKQTVSAKAEVKRETTVAELKEILNDIPDHAKITLSTYAGDRPWDSGTQYINFSWTIGS